MIPVGAFIGSALIAYIATIPVMNLARKYSLVTDSKKRHHPAHTHTGIIPRAGGIPIFLAILVSTLFFIELNKIIIAVLIGSGLLVLIGTLDDYHDISPYLRFVLNIVVAAIVIAGGAGIPYISNPLGGVIHLDSWKLTINFFGSRTILIFADLIGILWLTWTMNTVNWSKGVDGQLPGFVAITAFFLALLSQRFTGHDIRIQQTVLFALIISGAYIGFLPHNFYPQKIMPGYGGGALAGFLLGILSILSFGKMGTAILILSMPLVDAMYAILRRIRGGRSPFRADWGHFHHQLLEIGWGRRRIAVFYWIISFVLGIASLFLDGSRKMIAFLMVGSMLFIFMLIIDRMKQTYFTAERKRTN